MSISIQSISCRLCITICHDHRRLYDEDGRTNEVYALTEKYFATMLLNLEHAVICMECWRHMYDFHTFQESVLQAQKICLVKSEPVVKSEVEYPADEGEFSTVQCHREVTDTEESKDRLPEFEIVVKSEVDLVDYAYREPCLLRQPKVEEEHDNLGGVFAVRKFDTDESAASHSDSEGSVESCSSDDEEEVPLKMDQESISHDPNSYEITIKQEFDASNHEEPESNSQLPARPKYKNISHRTNVKRPQTVQDYDDLIARWRSTLACVICRESCATYSLLLQHFEQLHPSEQCHIICCELKFYHRYELEKHIHLHMEPQGPKRYACEECERVYTRSSSLLKHKKKVHLGYFQTFKCTICDKAYKSQIGLREHMATHTGERLYTCKYCPMTFIYNSTLYIHLKKVHAEERPDRAKEKAECQKPKETKTYQCPMCEKVYKNRTNFRDHMAVHTGEPTNVCKFCPKTFAHSSGLSKHVNRVHSQEWQETLLKKGIIQQKKTTKERKVHKCTICEKVFKRPHSLREHQAIHEGKTLYSCPHCAKSFNYQSRYHDHLKKEHVEERQEKEVPMPEIKEEYITD